MATANKTNKAFGNRKFYSLPEDYALRAAKPRASSGVKKPEDTAKLIKYIDDNVIGKNATFAGPFGRRKVVYCDYTASGRSLQFLEDYILKEVLPCYGNTHTTTSITSLQSTLYRHEARDIFRNAVNASEHDAVIFAGHGCTGAVHKLVHALSLPAPPVVFVGPAEHHSNLLPWRELGATMVRVCETRDGQLDLAHLEAELQTHCGQGRQLIGCFSAASNVTGVLVDDVAATALLHRYGALAFWDFAAAAPYVKIDMNPGDHADAAKDAVFFSVHKFVGGVQTPGVLVAKKALFRNAVPDGCGGGSVFFVSRDSHRYLQDTELREEGGTAAVVESVRAGLAMQLKEAVGVAAILAREEKMTRAVLAHCRTIPELVLLGPTSGAHKRLPIFSFMVKHPRGTFLHHNFVCMVLNDVFGIQARGGCACAGPYAQDLLGIDADLAQAYETALLEDSRLDRTHLRRHEEHSSYEMLRPGFARLSLPYFMSDAELAFVLEALKMVATEGWKLLPQYIVNPETGEWRHHTNLTFKERKWLGAVRYVDGKMSVSERRVSGAGSFPPDYAECLRTARGICNRARKMAQRCPLPDQNVMFEGAAEHLRWFMLPSEAQDLLLGHSQNVKTAVPFDPSQPQTPRQLSPRHSQHLVDVRPQSPGAQRLPVDTRAVDNSQGDITLGTENTNPQQLLTQCSLNPNNLSNAQRLSMDSLDTQLLSQCSLNQTNVNNSQRLSTENMVPHQLLTPCHLDPNTFNNLQRLSIDSVDSQQLLTRCSLTQNDLNISQRLSIDSNSDPQNLFMQCHLNPNTLNNSQRPSMDSLETQQLLVSSQCQLVDMQGRPLDLQRHSFDAQQLLYNGQCQQPEVRPQCYQTNSQCYQTDQRCRPNPSRQFLSAETAELSRSLSHSPVHFVLGDPTSAPRFAQVPRERCFSLGADASFSLPAEMARGGDETLLRDGSSQTELNDVDRFPRQGPRHSSSAEAFLGDSTVEGISAYVREMTKDIATEIKSEIREVISQVEDVLFETQDVDHHDRAKPAAVAERRNGGGSVSVNDVMDYLMECSREMASEVKHEIRSAVEVLNSPEAEHHLPAHAEHHLPAQAEYHLPVQARLVDLAPSSDGSSDETVVLQCRPTGTQAARVAVNVEAKAEDMDTEDGHTLNAENKQCALMRSTINSISSQDSGINLVFPESDSLSTASLDEKPRKRKLNLSVSSPTDNARPTNGMRGSRWHCPPKAIWKPAVEALHEFGMIRDGDRVLVCLSGGKDSLSLLHTLRQFQFYARAKGVDFALGAATVDPGSSAYDPRPLIPYLAALGVPYLYEEQPILEQAAALPNACSSVCSFCSRMKRGRLYSAARANGYNVLALGQHLDDLVESFFMSAFHNGRLRSMKAHYLIRERDLRVIRPLVYVREKALRQFAESRNLPVIAENCPACFEAPKERFRSKQLLAQQEVIFPKLFWSLRTALHPLICFRKTGEEALAFSRQHRATRALALAQPQEGSDTDEEEA